MTSPIHDEPFLLVPQPRTPHGAEILRSLTPSHHIHDDVKREYHPEFASPQADVVLQAEDGTCFRMHAFLLKLCSGVFRTTLSLPQPAGTPSHESVIGPLQESKRTIEIILRLISGMEVPHMDSYDVIEPLLVTAEKWDMPGAMSILKGLVMGPHFTENPLRLYVLACRFDWPDVAKFASARTLTQNIFQTENERVLECLASRDLLRLLILHKSRRDEIVPKLDAHLLHPKRKCGHHDADVSGLLHRERYRLLALKMLDRDPSGRELTSGFMLSFLEKVKCERCQKCVYDMYQLTTNIKKILAELPQTV